MFLENDVTAYELKLLRDVVTLYVRTAQPVSSKSLKIGFGLSDSPANLRKTLHILEEKGYLFKPHVSAGRVPSDKGYRLFVEAMETRARLSRNMLEELRIRIGRDWSDIREVMHRTSKILSELTDCLGLMFGFVQPAVRIERLSIVQMEGSGALVVLYMQSGEERKAYIEFAKRYKSHILDRAVHIINERISGYGLDEAKQRLDLRIRQSEGDEREIAASVSGRAEHLFDVPYDIEFHLDGTAGSSKLPEFSDPDLLQALVRIMGERRLMINIMKDRIREDVIVTIGRENILDELGRFSLVTRGFSADGYDGVFGVLGPTRMAYDRVISLLDRMGSEILPSSK